MKFNRFFPLLFLTTAAYAAYLAFYPFPAAKTSPIRIAINPWPGYEFITLAEEKGFFDDEGVEVQLIEISSLADIRRVFEREQVDMMTATLSEVVAAQPNTDHGIKIVMIPDFSNGTDVILASEEFSSLESLKGRRIGVEVRSLGMFFLSRALQKRGLTPDDVIIVPVEQPQIDRLIKRGDLDAVVSYPPFSVHVTKNTPFKPVFTSAEIPGEIVDVLAVNASFVQSRPEDIVRIVRAWDRALIYAKEHPEETAQVMTRATGLTAEEFDTALKGIKVLDAASQLRYLEDGTVARAIEHVSTLVNPQGTVAPPLPGGTYLYLDAVRKVAQETDGRQ